MIKGPGPGFTCLAIESAGPLCEIAACRDGRISSRAGSQARDQSRHIYSAVTEALEELDLRLGDLDCIAFGCGPGGFTGLRVGAAVVQALSYAASIPVCRISSLASMALGPIEQHGADVVATCLDARMGEAYLAIYRAHDGDLVAAILEDCLVEPATFTIDPAMTFYAAGTGWRAHKNLLDRHRNVISGDDLELMPSARHLLALAEKSYAAGRTCLPHEAVPNYIRDKVTG